MDGLRFPTKGSLVIVGIKNSVRPMHLFGHNLDHHYYFELPREGSGIPSQLLGGLLHTNAMYGLSRATKVYSGLGADIVMESLRSLIWS